MTSKLTSHLPPDDFEMPSGCQADAAEDQAIASMLADAYDAPPVPRSLTKRLDAGFTEQWGHSPQLASSNRGESKTRIRSYSSAKRSMWFAGAIAASLICAFVLVGSSGQVAWAAVVAAMQRCGMVQISNDQVSRWLDLENGVACEQTAEQTQWIDLGRGIALTYFDPNQPPLKESLHVAHGSSSSREALLAVFLLGEPLSAKSLERFRGVRVVEQQTGREGEDSDSAVELQVRLATTVDERFDLSLQLDPETNLPLSIASATQAMRESSSQLDRRSLSYSQESTEQLRSRLLASDAAIALAAREKSGLDDANDLLDDSPARVEPKSTGDVAMTDTVHSNEKTNDDARQTLTASLPIGATTKWKPVTVIDRSDVEVQQEVDRILTELWKDEQIEPVPQASDLQLLRRAYLDLAGRTPTVTEVREYLNNTSDDRYQRLIERLLDSPDHASQMAAVWRSFLIPEGVDLDALGGREAFEKWLSEQFAADEPYDQIVRKLLLAEGRLSRSGPLLFYSALKLNADQLAARTSRVFLGMRLECAQCHDHPFEPWTQKDFWSYAAFFAQISRPKGDLESVSTLMRVQDVDRGEVMLPDTEVVIQPRFLGQSAAEQQDDASAADDLSPRRQRLANWLTGPDNPYFARATVNRVWSHMFGRGIVDPVDDFGDNNHPVSPELLDTLASQFIESEFDLKTLIRTIALSKAYQLSSSSDRAGESVADTAKRLEMFAQMNVKTLTAEQLYDCIAVATLLDPQNASTSQYVLTRFGNSEREQFLQQFASPSTSRSEYLAGIPQALMLMNGSLIAQATGEGSSGLIESLDAPFFTDAQRIDVLFMATLSRPARPDEMKLVAEFLPAGATASQRRSGLADLLWALINSSEFTLNH
ncbi:DUF1549 and DUF1553 domain-containing protein [Neorhodopirellula pilleata]|uniref:Protein containing DUF1549 n=1 Tax=Neorhodopirellula pilleata TaxID=2714738 RepID=A0A5C6AQ44_9BACT|nr:DUF1549 and DUF1553 domain-containing protein [Neorhodopirellula pilleata]TWU01658.1 hypothetical protein Pla100_13930 [Neorhodopirellula pilleata]